MKMETTKNLVTGITTIAVLVVLFLVSTATTIVDDDSQYRYNATFSSVLGLRPNSAVIIAGINRGIITDISVVDGKAIVEFALDSDLKLKEGAAATLQSKTLMGGKKLIVIQGEEQRKILPNRSSIPVQSPVLTPVEIMNMSKFFQSLI